MNDILDHRAILNEDVNTREVTGSKTETDWKVFKKEDIMSITSTIYPDLQTKNNIKIDCIKIQKKIPEIKEVYYKKTSDEIKLFIFFIESDFSIRSKIFDEIVELRNKYKSHFDFKVFTLDLDREVIESGMEKLI